MPDNRRHKRSGGGLDLGAILAAIGQGVGGIEYNEDFNKQGPLPNGETVGGEGPYKAKTWFDRNEASRLNAEYRAGQVGADNQVTRALRQREGEIPLKVKEEQEVGKVKNDNTINLREREIPLNLKEAQGLSGIKMSEDERRAVVELLAKAGIIPTAANQQQYDTSVVPEIMRALQSKNVADTQVNNFTATKNFQNLEHLKATAPSEARKVLADSEFGARSSEDLLGNSANIFRNRKLINDQEPIMRESELVRNGMMPITNDTKIFNSNTGKLAYDSPDPMAAILRQGQPATNIPTAPQEVDGEIVIVGGKKYLLRK